MRKKILKSLFSGSMSFEDAALTVYEYQSKNNAVYREYLRLTGKLGLPVEAIEDIAFLPIDFFKSHSVKTGNWESKCLFQSSGTTGSIPSVHPVRNESFYLSNAAKIFEDFYGKLKNFHFFALLPGYLERGNSSLVAMAAYFIKHSGSRLSGFYLNEWDHLQAALREALADESRQVILLGVSFALLDFAEATSGMDLSGAIVMETGGMKGRRKEIIREELHSLLGRAFNVSSIHSEYGMTELFSQAYSKGEGLFVPGKTMQIVIREYNDPFGTLPYGKTGLVNVVDLANVDTCSFIATDDIGRLYADRRFEILGRYDHSDTRGCNLMVAGM